VEIGTRRGEAAVSALLELERDERRRKIDVIESDYMNALKDSGDVLTGKLTSSISLAEAATVVHLDALRASVWKRRGGNTMIQRREIRNGPIAGPCRMAHFWVSTPAPVFRVELTEKSGKNSSA